MRLPTALVPILLTVFASCAFAADDWRWQDALVPEVGIDLDRAAVVRVTTLASEGRGSLRDAVKVKGPRLVVFEVGGVIDLGKKGITIDEPDLLIAGQTAPAPGITLIRGGLRIRSDRTLIQHLRVRPGDAGAPKRSGWEPDGIATGNAPADVWIDHCSATWSVDENLSASSTRTPDGVVARRIFIRHCIIAEGLNDATHAKGPHSKGTLVFGGTQQVAIVENLYSSNVERNPVFQPDTAGVVVNNVIANPGERAIHAHGPDAGDAHSQKPKMAVVGNVVLFGEKTKPTAAIYEGEADAFFSDNKGTRPNGEALPVLRRPMPTLEQPPLWPAGLEAMPASAVRARVQKLAGARPADRDAIDARIVRQAFDGTARIIDSQEEVGGYPSPAATKRTLEVPSTGRRAWLEALAREVTLGRDP